MNIWQLVFREISHRLLNSLLALLSVSVAVGCLIGALTLLKADEIRTSEILEEKKQEVEKAGTALNDAMRKITKGLGFNILILPEDQDLNELHVEGVSSKSIPEAYVKTLAESDIVTVNHLLPMVSKKVKWKEFNDQTIIVVGTRGEVPIKHRALKKPLLDHVPEGTMVIGYQLHTDQNLHKDDTVSLLGSEFTIRECYAERGTADDSTVWINLGQAQQMFGMQNLVNAILALECNCATEDRVAEIRQEIAGILPGTQVVEKGPPALARAEARNKAAQAAEKAQAQETAHRAQLRQQREGFAAVLVPIVIIGSAVWIGFLAFNNVRQRRSEIGILRALGVRSPQILTLFLGKAVAVGLIGAAIGYAAGYAVGVIWGDLPATSESSARLFVPQFLAIAVLMAPALTALASWMPAMLAAGQDPATILHEE